eukprot:6545398-Lingulodinium_polyedra.AAC.1
MTKEEVAKGIIGYMDWLGNAWADFFAKQGAERHRAAPSDVEALKASMGFALRWGRAVSWSLEHIVGSGRWEDKEEE